METPLAYLCPNELQQEIRLAFFRNNKPLEPKAASLITADFQRVLKNRYPRVTISEINYIFEKGCFGEYGQNFGLSEVDFCRWIDEYHLSDAFHNALVERQQKAIVALPQKATPSKEEKMQYDCEYMLRKWKEFLTNGYDITEFGVLYLMFVRYNLHKYDEGELLAVKQRLDKDKEQKNSKKKQHNVGKLSEIFAAKFQTSDREVRKYAALDLLSKLKVEKKDFEEIVKKHLKKYFDFEYKEN
jgi:hypothetical protein